MKKNNLLHQYVERESKKVVTEKFIGDASVQLLYNPLRENSHTLFKALTSKRMSAILAFIHYNIPRLGRGDGEALFKRVNANWRECVEPLNYFTSFKKVFERQIRYRQQRPMETQPDTVVSPADCRILVGSLKKNTQFFIKEKFFNKDELLGTDSGWCDAFEAGNFCICRLTPDKYHYNHVPVSGVVVDIYSFDGHYHSCNPSATIAIVSIYSKNRRVITIIDTDVEGGSWVGLVAMVEIVALMIGDIQQAYSETRYENPQPITKNMFIKKGAPKSLYRPGSSTDVMIFQAGRIRFANDLLENSQRQDVQSRFTNEHGTQVLVETDIQVRSTIAYKI